jgi:hypothetical protein
MAKHPGARKGFLLQGNASYSGEGELHAFLRQLGWTQKQFCEYAGIDPSAFTRWRGHPLARWPVELLRLLIENQRFREVLKTRTSINPDQYSPAPPPPMPTGRYPRKRGDLLINGKPLTEWSPWSSFGKSGKFSGER